MSEFVVFEGAPVQTLVDSQVGIAFGRPWGSHATDLLEEYPTAVLAADEGDVQDYLIPQVFRFCAYDAQILYRFRLDQLIAVELHWGGEGIPEGPHLVAAVVDSWFLGELEEVDEGFYSVESDTTRVVIDYYEQCLRLEELEE